jgi:hypothetical protein
LRHSPLEAFMRLRGLRWVVSGDTRITDNLAGATIYVLNRALDSAPGGRAATLSATRHPGVGQIACTVSANLALLIQEPTYWRTAALVATARLLEKSVGLSAAAHIAAAAAREYSVVIGSSEPEAGLLKIGHAVREAVERNDLADETAMLQMIGERLASIPADAAPRVGPTAERPHLLRLDGANYQV